MRPLPPITTTVCPASSGWCWAAVPVVAVATLVSLCARLVTKAMGLAGAEGDRAAVGGCLH
jgi:hypothetical protein